MRVSRGLRGVPRAGKPRVETATPCRMSTHEVWETSPPVNANQGAAGGAGQSRAEGTRDLMPNLDQRWQRWAAGRSGPRVSAFPPGCRRIPRQSALVAVGQARARQPRLRGHHRPRAPEAGSANRSRLLKPGRWGGGSPPATGSTRRPSRRRSSPWPRAWSEGRCGSPRFGGATSAERRPGCDGGLVVSRTWSRPGVSSRQRRDATSRLSRAVYSRFREGAGVRFLRATRRVVHCRTEAEARQLLAALR